MIIISPSNTTDFDHVRLALGMSSLPDAVTSEYDVADGSKFLINAINSSSLEGRSHLTHHFVTFTYFISLSLSHLFSLILPSTNFSCCIT